MKEGRERTADVEESRAGKNVSDLLVFVHMSFYNVRSKVHHSSQAKLCDSLLEEVLNLALIRVAETLFGHIDRVPILVASLSGNLINLLLVVLDRDGPVQDSTGGKSRCRDGAARVVWKALVARNVVEVVRAHDDG